MKSAMLFPGQGAQFIGMGQELYDSFKEAKEVFQEVDDALNQKLSKLMFAGELDELTQTSNTQPAIMSVSIAALKVLEKQSGKRIEDLCQFVAGHSLGEYSALCAAGTFTLPDTAKLLRIRGEAMQSAVPVGKGAMLALLGATQESAAQVCNEVEEIGVCEIANDNGSGQIVLSGEVVAINKAAEIASIYGIKKAIKLNVSAPFHSSLMRKAGEAMDMALRNAKVNKPVVPVVANVSVQLTQDPDVIKSNLIKQVTQKVRWRETMEFFASNEVGSYLEVGPNKVLAGIAKRMHPEAEVFNIHTPKDIEDFLNRV